MEGFSIYNSTNYKILISIFHQETKIESAYLEPSCPGKDLFHTDANFGPGIYRLQGEIISVAGNIVFETYVNVNFPSAPIKIETDDNGNFWWKVNKDKALV